MKSLALGVFVVVSAASWHQPPGRRCLVYVLNADRGQSRDIFNNGTNINYDAAGNVRLRCRNQNVFLQADSISSLSGNYVRLYGHVVYSDTSFRFVADTALYTIANELFEGRGHVRVLDKTTGSTLVGPSVDYWREVKGVNDSARVEAILRPTIRYFAKIVPVDTVHQRPYILSGQTLKGFGQSRLWGNGNVTIDRDSLHGAGDSLSFLRDKPTTGRLWGAPALLHRVGTDSFTVFGKEIRVGLEEDRLRELRAFLTARVVRGGSDIAGDTVRLSFADDKLALTQAWSHDSGATMHSSGYDVRGDSLAVESPGEKLREVRVFKRGMIQNPRDTIGADGHIPGDATAADTTRNTLWGNRLVARFDQVDSAGTTITRLRSLQAYGDARSLYSRTVVANGRRTPSINYIQHADTLIILMKQGDSTGVASVQAHGHVYGAQLETASLRKPGDTIRTAVPGVRP